MEKAFEKNSFAKRAKSMLKVDTKRLFISPFFYIMVGISLVVPILILVMTTMMGGTSIDPLTGEEIASGTFTSVWQILGSAGSTGAGMDITSMCNINMMYFAIAVLVCIFVCDDFRSGYAKNLFTVRAKKSDYVASKTIAGFIGGSCMILAFVLGSILGGAMAGLSFEMVGFNTFNLICSILTKVLLVPIFASIFLTMSVIGKEKTWLAMCLSLGVGMFLFMMIPIASPLNAGIMNIILCLAGGACFSLGLGTVSNLILKKTSLV